jgi:hypothetical protein
MMAITGVGGLYLLGQSQVCVSAQQAGRGRAMLYL